MKSPILLFALLAGVCLCFSAFDRVSVAEIYHDYQKWNLPHGAVARFGKGDISEGDRVISYSPDGTHLAVATKIGV
ncbi:MAG: hypothetical protein OXN17_17670 [Candidatus Poribacteria bacterium]|nr:hypothetical protein [Candidatus Poribacteria bacterium]MDE0505851.1 hypothetical protein [Candidatus Poribacteria bacterium]